MLVLSLVRYSLVLSEPLLRSWVIDTKLANSPNRRIIPPKIANSKPPASVIGVLLPRPSKSTLKIIPKPNCSTKKPKMSKTALPIKTLFI